MIHSTPHLTQPDFTLACHKSLLWKKNRDLSHFTFTWSSIIDKKRETITTRGFKRKIVAHRFEIFAQSFSRIPSVTERKHLFREQLSLSLISALLSTELFISVNDERLLSKASGRSLSNTVAVRNGITVKPYLIITSRLKSICVAVCSRPAVRHTYPARAGEIPTPDKAGADRDFCWHKRLHERKWPRCMDSTQKKYRTLEFTNLPSIIPQSDFLGLMLFQVGLQTC